MHAENYVSVKYRRTSAAAISAEYAELVSVIGSAGTGTDRNLASHRSLLEIEQHLTAGHELFGNRKFQQAIEEYKIVQGLAYRLLNPSFPVGLSIRPDVVVPIR